MDKKLERYAEIQALVQKEARDIATQVYNELGTKYGVASVPFHEHNGVDSPKVPSANIVPGYRANGTIEMSTNGAVYELGLNFNASAVQFLGIAVRNPGTIDIRAHVVGNAQLGPTYQFQAQSSTSVKTGGPIVNVIQGCSTLLIDSSVNPPVVRALVSELNLVYVAYPTPVAVANIVGYGPGVVYVQATLATNWSIFGNFVVT